MANISDVIENFILKTLGEDRFIDISRNELANFFSCANSQINYVLETRFTMDKGYIIESRRGGGGFIRITRVPLNDEGYVNELILESIGDELSYKRMQQMISRLTQEDVLTKKEGEILGISLSDNSLTMPISYKDKLRANSFKNVLMNLLKDREE